MTSDNIDSPNTTLADAYKRMQPSRFSKPLEELLNEKIIDYEDLLKNTSSAAEEKAPKDVVLLEKNKMASSVADNDLLQGAAKSVADIVNKTANDVIQLGMNVVRSELSKQFNVAKKAQDLFYSVVAEVASFGADFALEMAYNSAKNIDSKIREKIEVNNQLQLQLKELQRLCLLLARGEPFFDAMMTALLSAYTSLGRAQTNFEKTITGLDALKKLNMRYYSAGVSNLKSARDTLLQKDIKTLDQIKDDFGKNIASVVLQKESLAVFLQIPQVTLKIAKLVLKYIALSTEVNLMITSYVDILKNFSEFVKNDIVTSAMKQRLVIANGTIVTIRSEMNAFMADLNNGGNKLRIPMQAAKWGGQVAGIYELVTGGPFAAGARINESNDMMSLYLKSIEDLKKIGPVTKSGVTVTYTNALENYADIQPSVTPFIIEANIIIATLTTKKNIKMIASKPLSRLALSKAQDQKILAAITPLLSRMKNRQTTVRRYLGTSINNLYKAGFDRFAGLLTVGGMDKIKSITPETASNDGMALKSVSILLSAVKSKPEATDEQVAVLTKVRENIKKNMRIKEKENDRMSGEDFESALKYDKDKVDELKKEAEAVSEVEKSLNVAEASPYDQAYENLSKIVGTV